VMVQSILDNQDQSDYYFMREFLTMKEWHTLTPYAS
jgi:hypothetical protein